MSVKRDPILKRCRTLGIEPMVLGIDKKSNKKPKKANKKVSEYGMQLTEKQKVKFIYGVGERQFRKYFEIASSKKGITGENLLTLLESRLDNVVFRMGFAKTRAQARQYVNHGQFTVNGKKVDIASYIVKAGDVIAVKENKKDNKTIKENIELSAGRAMAPWVEVDGKNMSGKIVRLASREDIDYDVAEHLIVELYSKLFIAFYVI